MDLSLSIEWELEGGAGVLKAFNNYLYTGNGTISKVMGLLLLLRNR